MRATVRHCVVLAGGRITRDGGVVAEVARPLPEAEGLPLLGWTLRELQRFGVERFTLRGGPAGGAWREAMAHAADLLPKRAELELVGDEAPWPEETVLVLDGDLVFDAVLSPLLAGGMGQAVSGGERLGLAVCEGGMLAGMGQARLTAWLGTRLPARALPGHFADLGTAGGARWAAHDMASVLRRPALILDRDGVMNLDHGYVGTRERWDWVPGAREAVAMATASGWHVFVATNQSGVARGHYTEADVAALMGWVADELRAAGGTLDDWRHCPFHPEAVVPAYRRESDWRKPAPGMLLHLLADWGIAPAHAVMVGDKDIDMAAARAAGVRGVLFEGGDLRETVSRAIAGPRAA